MTNQRSGDGASAVRPWLLIPLRSLADGKTRLAPVLDAAARERLNETLLDQLLSQARAWPGLRHTVVVSPCVEVLQRARAAGARVLRQQPVPRHPDPRSNGLNAGLEQARAELLADGARAVMVVSCDLPLAHADDLRRLAVLGCCDKSGKRRVVVAADRAGRGTNALYLPEGAGMPFGFGPDSAGRHLRAARRLGIPAMAVNVPGLAFDIDTPVDLDAWHRDEALHAWAPSTVAVGHEHRRCGDIAPAIGLHA